MVLGTATSYLGTGLVRGEVGHQSMYVVHVGNVLSVDNLARIFVAFYFSGT
eukprot:COSAG01_NODE_404_length_17467_cov_69.758650_15_plen_51_part_00